MNIAFIGLGAMGAPMASNLVRSGAAVSVFNRSPGRAEMLAQEGATKATSPAVAATAADIVCTCVSTPEALRAVLLGSDGGLAGARPGTLFVDFSTVDPATARELAAHVTPKGCAYLEAPVSGGVKGARDGTLTIMVGGDESDYAHVQPVLEVLGTSIAHVGPLGAASTIKLINQMLVGTHLAVALQAFALAQAAGVNLEQLLDVLTSSTGDSAMLRRGARNLFGDDFEPGFKVDLLLKDLRLVNGLGQETHVPLTVAAAAEQLYAAASANGLGERDIAAAVFTLPWQRPGHSDEGDT